MPVIKTTMRYTHIISHKDLMQLLGLENQWIESLESDGNRIIMTTVSSRVNAERQL